jgi:hypothetical protein
VSGEADLFANVEKYKPGETITVTVLRSAGEQDGRAKFNQCGLRPARAAPAGALRTRPVRAPEEAAPLLPRAKGAWGAGGAQRLTADSRRGGRLDFRVQLGVAQVKNAPRF